MANKVIWLHPHFRPKDGRYPRGYRNVTDRFADEMPAFLKLTCGVGNVVNTYPMTKALVQRATAVMAMLGFTAQLNAPSQYDKTRLCGQPDQGTRHPGCNPENAPTVTLGLHPADQFTNLS